MADLSGQISRELPQPTSIPDYFLIDYIERWLKGTLLLQWDDHLVLQLPTTPTISLQLGEQPETTWRQQLDTEELRNTLIAAMAAKLDISLTRLQATETEALVELARVPPPQRMPHQSR